MARPAQHIYEFGPFRLDSAKRLLWHNNETVHLTSKCFDILLALVESNGDVISKDELMKQIWPDSIVEEGNLTYNISVLRKTLGERADEHRYIVTVPTRGYQFVASAIEVSPLSTKEVALAPPDFTDRDKGEAQGRQVNDIGRHTLVFGVLALAVAAVIGVGWYILWGRGTAEQPPISKVAVLPLANGTGDPEIEYFADGVSDSLINSLSQLPGLKVIAQNSSFRYKGKEIDVREVARSLGVDAILMGRIVQRGENLLISVELVDARDKTQVWGEQYDRKASDLLAVRQELARDIVGKLGLRLGGEDERRLTRGDAANTEAYQLYLKGRYFWNRRTGVNIKKAIEYFQQAIERDPNYALAYVGLADCYVVLEEYAGTPTSETEPKARAALQRALQIDESLAEAHASLAMIENNSWNFREAEGEFKRAIELKPNYPTAHHWYCFFLTEVRGRFDEAMGEIRLAQQLDPLSLVISISVAIIHETRGELDAAIEESKKVLELDPNFPEAHRVLGVVYRQQGRYEEAIAESEKAVELSGRQGWGLANLGVCYAVEGNKSGARAILKELEERYNRGEALGRNLANVYAALGDKERGFAWLEKDFQARSGLLRDIARASEMDNLRAALSSDPRWDNLLRRIGLLQN